MYACAVVKLAGLLNTTNRNGKTPFMPTSMNALTSESQELRERLVLPSTVLSISVILMESTYMPYCGHWKRTTSILPTPVLSGIIVNLNSMLKVVVDCRVNRSLAHTSSSLSMNSGTTPSRRTLELGLKQVGVSVSVKISTREQFPVAEDPFTATAEEGMTKFVGKATRREMYAVIV